jgi:hypothetical protein
VGGFTEEDYYDTENYLEDWIEFTLRDGRNDKRVIYTTHFTRLYKTSLMVLPKAEIFLSFDLTVELILYKDAEDIFWLYPRLHAECSARKGKDAVAAAEWERTEIKIELSGSGDIWATYYKPTKSYPKIEKK